MTDGPVDLSLKTPAVINDIACSLLETLNMEFERAARSKSLACSRLCELDHLLVESTPNTRFHDEG